MDYLSNNVAVNLKRFRQYRGMSLDQMAERTGVSKSMLAQIERGQANPSIGVLSKITAGLQIEFEDLIQTPKVTDSPEGSITGGRPSIKAVIFDIDNKILFTFRTKQRKIFYFCVFQNLCPCFRFTLWT